VQAFTTVSGAVAPLMLPNITTDAMSPMIAGQSVSADLGALLFANWRYRADGSEIPEFVLNKPRFRESKILLAGPNFGCGSSRERAVWALMRFGIRVVIAPSFADIFYDNAFQNGLLPVTLPAERYAILADAVCQVRAPVVTVDLLRNVLQIPDGREIAFEVPAERRTALLEGLHEIEVIVRMQSDIDAFEAADRKARSWIYLERDVSAPSESGYH
jgi:3-isopropylmalate/(R)-2-methylmalate dehydratase small subunit